MIASLDSSVLVAAVIREQPRHAECLALIQTDGLNALTHAFSEFFSQLTGGRLQRRVPADIVADLIETTLRPRINPVELGFSDLVSAVREAQSRGIRGGAIYDYLHLVAARKAGAARIYTLNVSDFRAFWRDGDPEIVHP